MVMGGDSCSKVVRSNPGAVYWMVIKFVVLEGVAFQNAFLILQNCRIIY